MTKQQVFADIIAVLETVAECGDVPESMLYMGLGSMWRWEVVKAALCRAKAIETDAAHRVSITDAGRGVLARAHRLLESRKGRTR